jgi:hypothetical protein
MSPNDRADPELVHEVSRESKLVSLSRIETAQVPVDVSGATGETIVRR